MSTYYKTIIRYEILSEDAPWSGTLEDLAYDVTEGGCSGQFLKSIEIELTADEMCKALLKQGSDPSFFNLSDEE